eukprot:7243261-Prymnesium_polylepis.1
MDDGASAVPAGGEGAGAMEAGEGSPIAGGKPAAAAADSGRTAGGEGGGGATDGVSHDADVGGEGGAPPGVPLAVTVGWCEPSYEQVCAARGW